MDRPYRETRMYAIPENIQVMIEKEITEIRKFTRCVDCVKSTKGLI